MSLDSSKHNPNRHQEGPELVVACEKGDIEAVKRLIAGGMDVNARFSLHGMPHSPELKMPLSTAAQHGHEALVLLLLQAGADPNLQSGTDKNAPLHEAAQKGHLSICQMLHQHGANPELQNRYGQTPLFMTAKGDQPAVCEWLLGRGVDVNAPDIMGDTPLLTSTWFNTEEHRVVDLLLAHGADVNTKNKNKLSNLFNAAYNGNVEIFEKLLRHGADVREKKLLHTASIQGHQRIVEMLLDAGCDMEEKNTNGVTPLMAACFYKQIEVALFLLQRGADAATMDNKKESTFSSLMVTSTKNEKGWFSTLPDPSKNLDGIKELCFALIRHGADPTVKVRGVTAWGMASRKGQKELAESIKAFHQAHQAAQSFEKTMQARIGL